MNLWLLFCNHIYFLYTNIYIFVSCNYYYYYGLFRCADFNSKCYCCCCSCILSQPCPALSLVWKVIIEALWWQPPPPPPTTTSPSAMPVNSIEWLLFLLTFWVSPPFFLRNSQAIEITTTMTDFYRSYDQTIQTK